MSVSELVERLAVVLRAEERRVAAAHDLVPAQLEALRFLARANRYSRQPGAVAEWAGATPGTVSQTLSALERKGLLRKEADPVDQRRLHCVPTAEGLALVARVEAEGGARGVIPPELEGALGEGLRRWLAALQQRQGGRTFGVCRTCVHFRPAPDASGGLCGLTGDPLTEEDGGRLCREHSPPVQT